MSNPVELIRTYAPDKARVVRVLLRLLREPCPGLGACAGDLVIESSEISPGNGDCSSLLANGAVSAGHKAGQDDERAA